MKEFASVKVAAFDSDSLASTLTIKSAEGWTIVSIVSVREGSELVAFLSRDAASTPSSAPSPAATSSAPAAAPIATASSPSFTPAVPADWYRDPAGRYEYRYWDGTKWTEHVSRAGAVHKDPPTP